MSTAFSADDPVSDPAYSPLEPNPTKFCFIDRIYEEPRFFIGLAPRREPRLFGGRQRAVEAVPVYVPLRSHKRQVGPPPCEGAPVLSTPQSYRYPLPPGLRPGASPTHPPKSINPRLVRNVGQDRGPRVPLRTIQKIGGPVQRSAKYVSLRGHNTTNKTCCSA